MLSKISLTLLTMLKLQAVNAFVVTEDGDTARFVNAKSAGRFTLIVESVRS